MELNRNSSTLRDYRHGKKIFVDGTYRLSPKYGFLFYVEFDFNPLISNVSNTAAQELGMIVKTCGLPKFSIDTKVHNAYNRPNIVQNKIKYDQISITFHDDQADNVRNFWYDYYSYFFRDSDYADITYQGIHKYQSRPSFDWGYSPRPAPSYNNSLGYQNYQYIQAIRIYSLYQKNFSEYQLINPTITSFSHGQHQQGANELMEHQMTVQFETVKYLTGYTTENTVGGYIDLHYDRESSPLTPPNTSTDLIDNSIGGVTRATDQVTDLAYNNYMTQASYVQTGLQSGTVEQRNGFGYALGTGTLLSAFGGGTNSGGFGIPNLGSINGGIPNSAMIGQQLKASAAGIAGRLAGSAANGIVGAIGKGLGVNGSSLIGGLASIISNPQAALLQAQNGMIQYGTQMLAAKIDGTAQKWAKELEGSLGETIAGIKSDIVGAFSDNPFSDYSENQLQAASEGYSAPNVEE